MINFKAAIQHCLNYLFALRPWTFSASAAPIILGAILAFKYGEYIQTQDSCGEVNNECRSFFDPLVLLLTLIISLSIHGAGNLVNSYYDYFTGVDTFKGVNARDRILIDKILSPSEVVNLAGALYIFAFICLLLLSIISPSPLELLALVYFGGMSGSFLYTGGGIGLKYFAGLGDLVAMLIFGPVCVLFSFLAQTGKISWDHTSYAIILYSLPLFFNTECVLHSNNTFDAFLCPTKDTEYINNKPNSYNHINGKGKINQGDQITKNSQNIKLDNILVLTFAHIIGPVSSIVFYWILLFLPYFIYLTFAIMKGFWFLLPFLTCAKAFKLALKFKQDIENSPNYKLNLTSDIIFRLRNYGNMFLLFCKHRLHKNPVINYKKNDKSSEKEINYNNYSISNKSENNPFSVDKDIYLSNSTCQTYYENSLQFKNLSYKNAKLNFETSVFFALACYLTPADNLF